MILIIAAVPLETALLRQELKNPQVDDLDGYQILNGLLHDQQVLIAHSGVGQAAMAIRLTRLLNYYQPKAVLLCGCAGSYPNSGLSNGDLALASEEIFGDLGVVTQENFTPLAELDIPQNSDYAPSCQQRYGLSSELSELAGKILPDAVIGPFVTVSSCSGDPELSQSLEQRTGGICENMEGAAAAQVCSEFQYPLLELRGISNPTGSRDPAEWDIKLGAEAAQQGVLKLLQRWPDKED
jgi:futalosine hydrolase